jgi:hypothetical protein
MVVSAAAASERQYVMPQRPLDYRTPSPPPAKAKMGPLALGAVALLIYPFCLLANVMSLAAMDAPATRVADPLPRLALRGFLWGSTIYPVVYLVAAGVSVFLSSNDRLVGARRVAQTPLIYLAGVLLCFLIALATGA